MNWEKVIKQTTMPQSKQSANIYADGKLIISTDLYEDLGEPEAVEIFIDRKQKAIGLKSSTLQDSDSYFLKLKDNKAMMRIKSVFKTMGYEKIPSGKRKAEWDLKEKMVVIRVEDEGMTLDSCEA